ncbi:MAG: hypothetical protein H0W88_09550 [Parachlamydiaceae bacterium]|nr:hypothetical protein [Parachlamydiaceae bacterium]
MNTPISRSDPTIPSKKTEEHPPVTDKHTQDISKTAQSKISDLESSQLSLVNTIAHYIDLEDEISLLNVKIEKLNSTILALKKDETTSSSNTITIKEKSDELEEALIKLKQTKDSLSNIKIDLSLPQTQFIKKALKLIRYNPRAKLTTTQKNHLLSQAVHIGLKGYKHQETQDLQNRYQSTHVNEYSGQRAQYALDLLKDAVNSDTPTLGITTEAEKEGLLRVYKHRENFATYRNMFPDDGTPFTNDKDGKDQIKKIIDRVSNNINQLDKPLSPDVVTLENGTTTFVIPGGWRGHYISFEFRKNQDGTFEFVIHNRGENSDNKKFHGDLTFSHDGKRYARTRIPIRVTKEVLQNPEFLTFLIEHANTSAIDSTGASVYDKIHEYLIEKGQGKILISDQEKLATSLHKFFNANSVKMDPSLIKKREILYQILKSDPNFHSYQLFGTCGESNMTSVEDEMAPKNVHRALKFYTLGGFIDQMMERYLLNYSESEDIDKITTELEKMFTNDFLSLKINRFFDGKYFKEMSDKYWEVKKQNQGLAKTFEKQKALNKVKKNEIEKEINESKLLIDKTLTSIQTNFLACIKDEALREDVKSSNWVNFVKMSGTELEKWLSDWVSNIPDKDQREALMLQFKQLEESIKIYPKLIEKSLLLDEQLQALDQPEPKSLTKENELKEKLNSLLIGLKVVALQNPSVFSTFDQIQSIFIKEFGHARVLHIHAGERFIELQNKLKSPPKPTEGNQEENIQQIMKETIEEQFKRFLLFEASDNDLNNIAENYRELFGMVRNHLLHVNDYPNKNVKLYLLQALKEICKQGAKFAKTQKIKYHQLSVESTDNDTKETNEDIMRQYESIKDNLKNMQNDISSKIKSIKKT